MEGGMKIVTDSHYSIGKTHLVCEDYACHGHDPMPYVILSDGCSSSENTDVGARLLALNARQSISQFLTTSHWDMGRRITDLSAQQADSLGLPLSALNATLIVAFFHQDQVSVHLYGDGCVIIQDHDGNLQAIQIEYAGNAPYYLSYLKDAGLETRYLEKLGRQTKIVKSLSNNEVTSKRCDYNTSSIFDCNVAEFKALAVATDGLSSFVDVGAGQDRDLLEVAKEFMAFKNINGDFVKRRMRRALTTYRQQGIHNSDDIGFGAFIKDER